MFRECMFTTGSTSSASSHSKANALRLRRASMFTRFHDLFKDTATVILLLLCISVLPKFITSKYIGYFINIYWDSGCQGGLSSELHKPDADRGKGRYRNICIKSYGSPNYVISNNVF